jgi:hypothetical protein
MRFIVLVKGDKESEAGVLPDEKMLAEMTKYNEDAAKAGILLGAEGLAPSSAGALIRFSGNERTVIEGPFGKPEELIAGFWLIQANSRDEAIDWVKQAPNPFPDRESEIEIRQVYDTDDLGAGMTPELREKEKRLAEQMAQNARR